MTVHRWASAPAADRGPRRRPRPRTARGPAPTPTSRRSCTRPAARARPRVSSCRTATCSWGADQRLRLPGQHRRRRAPGGAAPELRRGPQPAHDRVRRRRPRGAARLPAPPRGGRRLRAVRRHRHHGRAAPVDAARDGGLAATRTERAAVLRQHGRAYARRRSCASCATCSPRLAPYLMYGLTESFRSTYLDPAQVDLRPDSIGRAIPNAEVLVLRPDGTRCAPDEPGELVHRGSLVALGYWNDPERTAARFRPVPGYDEPWRAVPEPAVWSGDTVVRDADGYLYFVGRADEMIKTSGYRVSPTEVEEAALGTGLVREAVALGVPDARLGQRIVLVAVAPGARRHGPAAQGDAPVAPHVHAAGGGPPGGRAAPEPQRQAGPSAIRAQVTGRCPSDRAAAAPVARHRRTAPAVAALPVSGDEIARGRGGPGAPGRPGGVHAVLRLRPAAHHRPRPRGQDRARRRGTSRVRRQGQPDARRRAAPRRAGRRARRRLGAGDAHRPRHRDRPGGSASPAPARRRRRSVPRSRRAC